MQQHLLISLASSIYLHSHHVSSHFFTVAIGSSAEQNNKSKHQKLLFIQVLLENQTLVSGSQQYFTHLCWCHDMLFHFLYVIYHRVGGDTPTSSSLSHTRTSITKQANSDAVCAFFYTGWGGG